ncbi:MAG: YqaA family protein [Thermoprotei archaeon]|jgi:membrane protein YqaA with SNARE-associated domain
MKRYNELLGIFEITEIVYAVIIVIVAAFIFLLFKNTQIINPNLFLETRSFMIKYGLVGVLLITIIGGTVIPLGSPILVASMALAGVPLLPLIIIASIGSTVGMIINYGLAYYLGGSYIVKKVSVQKLDTTIRLWNKYGWTIYVIFGLVPFLPIELLSIICGLLRVRIDVFIILTFITRIITYTILVLTAVQLGCKFIPC